MVGRLIRNYISLRGGDSCHFDVSNYSYNTGITLHALCLLQEVSPSPDLAAKAQRLVEAALDRSKSLFDTTVANTEYRYWWDFTFFLHLLFEGLTEYTRVFGSSNPATAAKIRTELIRHTAYMQKYIKDNNDGLYVLRSSFELLKTHVPALT